MRVAALYDIHGNLPALEAVMQEVRGVRVDCIVAGGDVIPGPMPRETLDCLGTADVPVSFIYGNGEVAVLDELAGREPRVPASIREVIRWNARQLDVQHRQLVAGWPKTLELEIPGIGQVLFCHATPQNENDIFVSTTPETALLPAFLGVTAPLVVCGHTHMPFDRTVGGIRVVNAGSVGMPFGEAGASWLLLSPGGVQPRHTAYDTAAAAARIRMTAYPQAGDFADKHVLNPPPAAEMMAIFSKVELQRVPSGSSARD